MDKIGFIGMGNMGYALMNGCLSFFDKDDVLFFDTNAERCEEIKSKTGVNYVSSVSELVESVKYVVLAIKPQVYEVALEGVPEHVNEDTIIISLAPGITVEKVRGLTSAEKIIRTMPNTPAMDIRQMSQQLSRGSAGEYQADEPAGVARLSWRVSGR